MFYFGIPVSVKRLKTYQIGMGVQTAWKKMWRSEVCEWCTKKRSIESEIDLKLRLAESEPQNWKYRKAVNKQSQGSCG